MPAAPNSYAAALAQLDEITKIMAAEQTRLANMLTALATSASTLQALGQSGTGYAGWAVFIETAATDNPGDSTWQALKAQKDKIVADFQAQRTLHQAVSAAADTAANA